MAIDDVANRLIVALDVEDAARARELARSLAGVAGFFKIGWWLLLQPGVHELIDDLVAAGDRVFLDAKIYDIGETARRGVLSAARRGVSFLTVHGDPGIMRAAADGRGDAAMRLLAVSVLTSLDDSALSAMGYGCGVEALVARRVRQAAACGMDGVIAAPTDDPARLRALAGQPLLVVTPGIRPGGAGTDDHARSATPAEAMARGADYLVVGRPITQAADPAAAAAAIVAEMRGAARAARDASLP